MRRFGDMNRLCAHQILRVHDGANLQVKGKENLAKLLQMGLQRIASDEARRVFIE